MEYVKSFSDFVCSRIINEEQSIESKVKHLSRHLAFDKDVIKYLNSTRSKREIGWRDLLLKKLHGTNQDYITYITKNMVQNMNPKITGPVSVKFKNDEDEDKGIELDSRLKGLSTDDKIEDINRRLEDVEDTLGIDPDNEDTLEKAKEKAEELGFDTIEDEEENDKEEEE